MKRDNINYFAVGLFVLAMLSLLFYAMLRINGENQKSDVYYTVFKSVSGIKPGTTVAYQGFELGHVDAIEPVQNQNGTSYKLALKLKQGWKVPSDSRALISSSGLLAGMSIDIREGSSSKLLAPGDTIVANESASLFDALALLTEQLTQIASHDAKPLFANLNRRIDTIGGSLEHGVPESMVQFQTILKKLDHTASLLESTLGGANGDHISAVLKNADLSAENIARLTTDLGQTRKQLDQLLAETNGLVAQNRPDINASVIELRNSLQRVSSILNHIEGASLNISELTRQLRQNPSLIIQSKPVVDQGEASK